MAKTLLVVDDSATMRKVFELTLAGEDVTVVTHDGSDSLLARARDARPSAAVVDVGLGDKAGYDVVRQLKGDPTLSGMPVLMLYSEHSPLDESRARDAGADGSLLKPFDTQVAIDKIKQALAQGPAASAAAPQPTAGRPVAIPGAAVPLAPPPAIGRGPSAAGVGSVGTGRPGGPGGLKATQMFVSNVPPAAAQTPPRAPAAPVQQRGEPPRTESSADIEIEVDGNEEISLDAPVTPSRAAAPPATSAVAQRGPAAGTGAAPVAAITAEVSERVAAMGLTPAQVQAVTALTREVVERVVWEVVPQLAESLIREEIRRLTAD